MERRQTVLKSTVLAAVMAVGPVGGAAAQQPSAATSTMNSTRDAANQLTEEVVGLFNDGRYSEAEKVAQRALDASRQVYGEKHAAVVTALNNLALIYRELSRLQEAEPLMRQALALSEAVAGKDHPDTLTALNNLAGVEEALGRYATAEQSFRRALTARQRTLGADNPDTLSTVANLAGVLTHQGQFEEAEALYRRITNNASLSREHPVRLTAMSGLAALLTDRARYSEAEQLFRDTIEAHERALGRDHLTTLTVISNFAGLYRLQQRRAEAEALYRRIIEVAEKSYGVDHPTTLIFVNNLASLYQEQRRYAEAEPLRLRTLAAHERARGPDHPLTFAAVNNLGTLYLDMGRTEAAEPLVRRAVSGVERRRGADHPETLTSLVNLAGLYRQLGRHDEAASLLQRVLATRERLLGRNHPTTIETAELVVLSGLRRKDLPFADLPAARLMVAGLRARQIAADQDEQGRSQRDREASTASARFALFGDVAWVAGAGQERTFAHLQEAFDALQRSIAGPADRSIAEQAARRYASSRDSTLSSLIAERHKLESEWAAADDLLAAAYSDRAASDIAGVAATEMRKNLEAIQTRIGEIDRRLRREVPEYYALIQSDPLDLERAQSLLKEDEGLLLAVPSPFGTHVVALTKEGVHWHRSQLDAPLVRAAVQVLRWDAGARVSGTEEELAAIREEKKGDGPPSYDRRMAHLLYRELVAPALPLLQGKERLVVATGGPLAGLPFSLLVSAEPSGSDFNPADLRNSRWFGDDFALMHIPSIRSLAILRGQPPAVSASSGFFGIGNPQLGPVTQERRYGTRGSATASQIFPRDRSRSGAAVDPRQLREMASLPGTAEELRLVRTALGAPAHSVIEGAEATEPKVRNLDLASARLILFSTHGLTSEEASGVGEAGLVLTPPAASAASGDDYTMIDAANDGYLAASEITTLRVNADWVILSACNTATGDDSANLSGLARAFFYAGARSLLASHWPVSDEVAPLLITRVVAPQQANANRAFALQVAMRSIREDRTRPEWAHPFYWAPFVLIGD